MFYYFNNLTLDDIQNASYGIDICTEHKNNLFYKLIRRDHTHLELYIYRVDSGLHLTMNRFTFPMDIDNLKDISYVQDLLCQAINYAFQSREKYLPRRNKYRVFFTMGKGNSCVTFDEYGYDDFDEAVQKFEKLKEKAEQIISYQKSQGTEVDVIHDYLYKIQGKGAYSMDFETGDGFLTNIFVCIFETNKNRDEDDPEPDDYYDCRSISEKNIIYDL